MTCIINPVPNLTWLFVAFVYAVAVWLARRGRVDLPWRIAAGFYLLVLLFLFRPLTGPYASYATDVVRMIPPWSNVLPPQRPPITKYEVSNLNTHDATMQLIPWAHQVREAWRSWEVPLWNAEAGCGYPLLANGQSSALSPLRLIALPLPLDYAMTAEAAMKLLIALTCMYLFCRRRYRETASIAAAIAFGFCTYVVGWLHFAHITAAVFLPAVLLGVDLLAGGFTPARLAYTAIVSALTVIAGHPETAIHIAMLAIPFALWVTLVEQRRVRALLSIAAAGLVAVLLSGPFLFPFIEALHRSQRYQETKTAPNRATPYSDFPSAALLVEPSITGHLPEDRPWGPTTIESVTGFTGIFGIVAFFAVAIDTIARRRWRERELLFVVLTIVVLGAILDWRIVSGPLHAMLGMVAHARLRFIFCALLSLHIASAIDTRRERGGVFILAGALLASALVLYVQHALPFPTPGSRDTALNAIMPSLATIAAAALFAAGRNRVMQIGIAALVATMTIELFIVDAGWNPSMPLRTAYPRTALIAALERMRSELPKNVPFRISGLGAALYPNTNVMFGFEDARVHDPMANGRFLGFLREVSRYDPADYYAKWDDFDSPLLDLLNVRFLVTDRGVDVPDRARFDLVYDGFDGRIYRNRTALPRFFGVRNVVVEPSTERLVATLKNIRDWRATAVVTSAVEVGDTEVPAVVRIDRAESDAYDLHLNPQVATLVVSSITLDPGWRIHVNGERVEPVAVNGPFLGFVVPDGSSAVTLRYRPSSFYGGLAALAIGMALLLSARLLHRRPA